MYKEVRFNAWQREVITQLIEVNPGWSCIDRLGSLFQAVMEGADLTDMVPTAGDGKDYNFWTFAEGWEVRGSCQHGSSVMVEYGRIEVLTCGGHWIVAAALPFSGTVWMTDSKPSTRSWGDTDDEEGLSLGLTPEEIINKRLDAIMPR